MRLWIAFAILGAALAAAFIVGVDGTIAGLDTSLFISLVSAATLLLLVGFSVLGQYRGRFGTAVRDLAVWIGLALVLVLGYGFRDDFRSIAQRVTGELMPAGEGITVDGTSPDDARAVRIRKRPDGHFVARGSVNGASLVMLVDTGASTVVLKPTDARAAGIDVDGLSYTVAVRTANGTAYAAGVRIKRIAIGGIVIEGVDALVAKPGALSESLLGMSFLKRLRSYEFSGDFLTLRS
jgi:aspartyl protease family protein